MIQTTSRATRAPRRFTGLLALTVALAVAAPAMMAVSIDPAIAQSRKAERQAEKYRDRGIDLYRKGRFRRAATEFAAAYERVARPDLLFAWAQSERKAGDCARAVELYRQFLDMDLPEQDMKAARLGIERCGHDPDGSGDDADESPDGAAIESGPDVAGDRSDGASADPASSADGAAGAAIDRASDGDDSAESAEPAAGAAAPLDLETETRSAPWHHDRGGALWISSGVLFMTAGLGTYLSGSSQVTRLDSSATHDQVTRAESSQTRRRIAGAVIGGLGAAAVTLGVLSYRRAHREHQRAISVEPYASADSAGVTVFGRF